MSKPSHSHMEAYLKYLRANVQQEEKETITIEAEYLRSIYKVLPREQGLEMSLRQARAQTSIRP